MSSVPRIGVAALLVAAIASAGCHSCPNHEKAESQFGLAEFNYKSQKFDQAKRIYMNALENCPELEEALLGLGNACREYGTDLYRSAQDLYDQGKREPAQKAFKDANENHGQAHKCFEELLQRHPEDLPPKYGLALLWYQRATSPWSVPYPQDDPRRVVDRDRAIALFNDLSRQKDDLYQVHRYLGLLYFVAGRMDDGRPHLRKYHEYQQRWYNVVMSWPQATQQQKDQKEGALRQVEREIDEAREVLLSYAQALKRERERLERKGAALTPEEKKSLEMYARESLAMESIIRTFVVTKLGTAELEVWQRCQLYFSAVNQGKLDDVLNFVFVRPGEEFLVRQKVNARLERGAHYEKLSHRTITIAGDTATVALGCERTARRGATPEIAELTLRFKLQGGQWLTADYDHP
jgi:tetratricopeptide (TPR) repeat protein